MLHHFVDSCDDDPSCVCSINPNNTLIVDCVTYNAISGATQTGPNIFWTWAALRYVAVSGDYGWLDANYDNLQLSMTFLLKRFDSNVNLFNVPGPLWIDTFIRANYTTDTNAAMIFLAEAMADMETFRGNTSGATFYLDLASDVRIAMNTYLYSTDHYCTQSDPDASAPGGVKKCSRDFVDYDSNLLAIGASAANASGAAATLARVDSGQCTHARGTWVSEIYYDW
jgi:hypothetical protein